MLLRREGEQVESDLIDRMTGIGGAVRSVPPVLADPVRREPGVGGARGLRSGLVTRTAPAQVLLSDW